MLKKIKLFNFLIVALSVNSCGIERGHKSRTPATELASSLTPGGRTLSSLELKVAVRICFALRTKRNNFNTVLMGRSFIFNQTSRFCNGSVSGATEVSTVLSQNSGNLFYQTSFAGEFMSDIETETAGLIAPLCEKIIKGDNTVNYYEKSNEAFEFSFNPISSNEDNYTIKVAQKANINGSEGLNITKIISHDIATNTVRYGKSLVGLSYKIIRYIRCNDDPSSFDSLEKTYREIR